MYTVSCTKSTPANARLGEANARLGEANAVLPPNGYEGKEYNMSEARRILQELSGAMRAAAEPVHLVRCKLEDAWSAEGTDAEVRLVHMVANLLPLHAIDSMEQIAAWIDSHLAPKDAAGSQTALEATALAKVVFTGYKKRLEVHLEQGEDYFVVCTIEDAYDAGLDVVQLVKDAAKALDKIQRKARRRGIV